MIYIINTKPLISDSLFQGLYLKSNQYFKQKIDLKMQCKDKNLVLGASIAFEIGLSGFGLDPDKAALEVGSKGKPYILGEKIFFNISHSGEMAVCAFGESEIGVDIEKKRPLSERVMKKLCLSQQDDGLTIWTRKEAFGKCLGIGIIDEILKMDLSKDEVFYSGRKYYIKSFDLGDYVLSVCMENAPPPNKIIECKGELT